MDVEKSFKRNHVMQDNKTNAFLKYSVRFVYLWTLRQSLKNNYQFYSFLFDDLTTKFRQWKVFRGSLIRCCCTLLIDRQWQITFCSSPAWISNRNFDDAFFSRTVGATQLVSIGDRKKQRKKTLHPPLKLLPFTYSSLFLLTSSFVDTFS